MGRLQRGVKKSSFPQLLRRHIGGDPTLPLRLLKFPSSKLSSNLPRHCLMVRLRFVQGRAIIRAVAIIAITSPESASTPRARGRLNIFRWQERHLSQFGPHTPLLPTATSTAPHGNETLKDTGTITVRNESSSKLKDFIRFIVISW